MRKKAQLLLAPGRKELLVPRDEPPPPPAVEPERFSGRGLLLPSSCVWSWGACSTQLTTMDQRGTALEDWWIPGGQ